MAKSYTYDAYGNTSSTGTFINSFAYTGAVNDTETGLYYMNARYYEPGTGRFISEDTYRGEGEAFWHLYLYCGGDPINNIDLTGHYFAGTTKSINRTYKFIQSWVKIKGTVVRGYYYYKDKKKNYAYKGLVDVDCIVSWNINKDDYDMISGIAGVVTVGMCTVIGAAVGTVPGAVAGAIVGMVGGVVVIIVARVNKNPEGGCTGSRRLGGYFSWQIPVST